jgi:hypothetical protein
MMMIKARFLAIGLTFQLTSSTVVQGAPDVEIDGNSVHAKWTEFVEQFRSGVRLSMEEHSRRFSIFADNLKMIERMNIAAAGEVEYTYLSPFADWTPAEFTEMQTLRALPSGEPEVSVATAQLSRKHLHLCLPRSIGAIMGPFQA